MSDTAVDRLRVWCEAQSPGLVWTTRQAESFDSLYAAAEAEARAAVLREVRAEVEGLRSWGIAAGKTIWASDVLAAIDRRLEADDA